MESVILSTPVLWIGYFIAFAIGVLGIFKRKTFVLPLLSAAVVVCLSAYALLLGASLYEAATVFLIFLVLNLIAFFKDTTPPNDKDDKADKDDQNGGKKK